ncbi:MAG TPA: hypothetical protein VNO21_12015 [Polyangiaceae bacterium]|nr:hypothetical protein [Polyangiaceae bacterium]
MRRSSRVFPFSSASSAAVLAAFSTFAFAALCSTGCAKTPPARTQIEDQSRKVAPLPACLLYLPARKGEAAGTARRLRDEQIFKLVFPAFDDTKKVLARAPACTEQNIFDDKALAGGAPKGGWPIHMQDGQILQGSGGDRIKVVWLRVEDWPDGTTGGPLAILRGSEHFAELYAVTPFRGRPDRVRLGTERMGGELLVTAEEDGCTGHAAGSPCETALHVFLPRGGQLTRVVDVPVERIAYGSNGEKGERGAQGKLEYHMTSSSRVQADGIHLSEEVQVKDDGGQVLRKAELERVFLLSDKGLTASEGSLWDRIAKPELAAESPASPEKEKPEKTKSPPHHRPH